MRFVRPETVKAFSDLFQGWHLGMRMHSLKTEDTDFRCNWRKSPATQFEMRMFQMMYSQGMLVVNVGSVIDHLTATGAVQRVD